MGPNFQYALSTFGKTIPFAFADAFTLYFLTEICHISPALAGSMIFAMLSWSALCDPLAGWFYHQVSGRLVSQRHYFLTGIAAMTALFVLSFALSAGLPLLWLIQLFVGMLFRLTYAMVDVPHNALISALQTETSTTMRFGAQRLFATIAGTLVAIFAAGFALGSKSSTAPSAFFVMALLSGAAGAALFFYFFPFAALKQSEVRHKDETAPEKSVRPSRFFICGAFFLSAVSATIINGLFSKDVAYVAKYVLYNPGWGTTGLALFTFGKVAAIPLWTSLSRWANGTRILQASFLLVVVTALGVATVPPHFTYLNTALFFFGIGIGGTNMTGWALISDCAGMFSQKSRALVFGTYTATTKIASGLSGAVIGFTLSSALLAHPSAVSGGKLYWLIYVYPIVTATLGILAIESYRLILTRHVAIEPS